MDWERQCAAVIPCFNEAHSIGEVVTSVRRHLPTVFVVDDGSTDETANVATNAGAEIIRLPHNTGKGAALRAGWRRALERGFAWALTLDGDGQHAPEDIPNFFSCAGKTGAALVVGNRMDQASAMPWLRRQVNCWMSRCLSRSLGVPLADSQCGFRLVNLKAAPLDRLATNHFEIESELLFAFLAAGCNVQFAPVQVIYRSSPSKIHPLMDSWRWFRWWFGARKKMAHFESTTAVRGYDHAASKFPSPLNGERDQG
jgi:glycosyltransferase involved in cell wall biosynthesis